MEVRFGETRSFKGHLNHDGLCNAVLTALHRRYIIKKGVASSSVCGVLYNVTLSLFQDVSHHHDGLCHAVLTALCRRYRIK
jgi:hypothetical protein